MHVHNYRIKYTLHQVLPRVLLEPNRAIPPAGLIFRGGRHRLGRRLQLGQSDDVGG